MTENCGISSSPAALRPETDSNIVAHDQVEATDFSRVGTLVDKEHGELHASSLDTELKRLSEFDTRKFGVQVLLQVASAWAKDTKMTLAVLGTKNTKLADENTRIREENAALKAKDAERSKHAPLVTSALLFGPIVATIGLDQVKSDNWGTGLVAIVIGLAMIGAALWARKGDQS